jgi:hypothetical protein
MAKSLVEIRSLARSHTRTAVRVLVGIMRCKDATPAARVSAANAILDRGWGKATQPLENSDNGALELIHRIERVIVPATAKMFESLSALDPCDELTLFTLRSMKSSIVPRLRPGIQLESSAALERSRREKLCPKFNCGMSGARWHSPIDQRRACCRLQRRLRRRYGTGAGRRLA